MCIKMLLGAVVAAACLTAAPAMAQMSLSAVPPAIMKGRSKVAVPSYEITFITQQQATAAATIGARTRLLTQLTGVDAGVMKRLTNEAHADLRAKLTAAGVPLVDPAQVAAATAGVERLAGNQDIQIIGRTITIGKGVAKGWASFGADDASAIKAFHNPTFSPMGMMGMRSGATALSNAVKSLDAVMLIPNLNIDFVNMEASTGRGLLGQASASASGKLNFAVRALATNAYVVGVPPVGPAYALGANLNKDVAYPGAFATVLEGEAAVRQLTGANTTDSNYLYNPSARGDAVVVNLPAWEAMVRKAFGDYNTAVVAAIVKARS